MAGPYTARMALYKRHVRFEQLESSIGGRSLTRLFASAAAATAAAELASMSLIVSVRRSRRLCSVSVKVTTEDNHASSA